MTDRRAVVAYRYSIPDIDAWTDRAVDVFYRHLTDEDLQP